MSASKALDGKDILQSRKFIKKERKEQRKKEQEQYDKEDDGTINETKPWYFRSEFDSTE